MTRLLLQCMYLWMIVVVVSCSRQEEEELLDQKQVSNHNNDVAAAAALENKKNNATNNSKQLFETTKMKESITKYWGNVDFKSTRSAISSSSSSLMEPVRIISLAESLAKTRKKFQLKHGLTEAGGMREYWKATLQEIRELAVVVPQSTTTTKTTTTTWSFGNATSSRMENGMPQRLSLRRFEGFPSWERLLQDWKEEVEEYLGERWPDLDNVTSSIALDGLVNGDAAAAAATTTTTAPAVSMPKPARAKPGEPVLPHTDISDKSKRVLIVTTASLPWMTGTAVNPLLRAAYLSKGRKERGGQVTLMLPWLERQSDQQRVYGTTRFDTPEDQERFVRTWLRETANMEHASKEIQIRWYTAWQNKAENSIYSMGDITALVPAEDVDICVLEEPEHLNWYRAPGESWTVKYKHVVGIVHTNYFVYAQEQPAALIRAPGMKLLCSWMCRAHCHRLIKLSGTLGQFAPEKELVENVHGVRGRFLEIGEQVRAKIRTKTDTVFAADSQPSVYFIGKMLWSKGLGSLMELLKYAEESADLKIKVDMYGGGPDKDAAAAKSERLELDMPFHGPLDHSKLAFTHKVFVNPSTSEVLCTTTAEALAMGKFVVLPSHPSNDFFAQFPNCLPYATKEEFLGNLYYALTHSPAPLTEEHSYALSWEAATKRFEAAGSIPVKEAEIMEHALASQAAGIDINLPPLIDSEEGRKLVSSTFQKSRAWYRQFRSRMSQEIQQSSVLPRPIKQRLVKELDKRLELNIDQILESPTLRLKLSPAELDRSLLDLYDRISQSPSGDVLRVIGGAQEVGMQNWYIKRQAMKQRMRRQEMGLSIDPLAMLLEEELDAATAQRSTVSEWVQWTLRRNLPTATNMTSSVILSDSPTNGDSTNLMGRSVSEEAAVDAKSSQAPKKQNALRMSVGHQGLARPKDIYPRAWNGLHPVGRGFVGKRSRASTFSILI